MPIPKVIHFIWAGGQKIMPENGMHNVASWAAANPDFEVKIWVDPVTDPQVYEKYKEVYPEIFKNSKIKLGDINQASIATPEVRYELDSLWPNYGASSDMLRYNILAKEGGAYFDCLDVFPNEKMPLSQVKFSEDDPLNPGQFIFSDSLTDSRLLLHTTPHSTEKGRETIGSEAIICSPGNKDMQKIAEGARDAYHTKNKWSYKNYVYPEAVNAAPKSPVPSPTPSPTTSPANTRLFARRLDMRTEAEKVISQEKAIDRDTIDKFRAKDTLANTGPDLVKRTLNLSGPDTSGQVAQKEKQFYLSKEVRTLPKEHAISWVRRRVEPYSYEEAFKKGLETIVVEARDMKLYNLSRVAEEIHTSAKNANDPKVKTIVEVKYELAQRLKKETSLDQGAKTSLGLNRPEFNDVNVKKEENEPLSPKPP